MNYSVPMLCRVMQVSKSGFYKWLTAPECKRSLENKTLSYHIKQIHTASREVYGRRRVHSTLRKQGWKCGKNRVRRLMKILSLRGVGKPKFRVTTNSDHKRPIAPNLLNRDFSATSPNRVWTSDITYIPTREGWLYLCIVLDVYSRAIVGWSIESFINADLVISALKSAVNSRPIEPGLIFHSDRGSQYASGRVCKFLEDHKMQQSMSGKGNCYDNAVTESFFSTLKRELIHRCDFCTRSKAASAVFEFIEVFYNRKRSHSKLGFLSPFEFERNFGT